MKLSHLTLLLLLAMPTLVSAERPDEKNVDPFEAINRPIFEFNLNLDKFVLRPVAVGYDFILPDVAQRGVANFFANLDDATAAFNAVLQGRFGGAATDSGRFLVNSTLGLAGLFDVASPMGLDAYRTDFGHTLALWGMADGPYIMLPLLGPRTTRSGIGTLVDTYTSAQTYIKDNSLRYTLFGVETINSRARLLQADELMTGDRYIFVRDAYLQNRKALANDGVVEDDFSDFGDDGWDEEF